MLFKVAFIFQRSFDVIILGNCIIVAGGDQGIGYVFTHAVAKAGGNVTVISNVFVFVFHIIG